MTLVNQINQDIKSAMLAKEKEKLEALRAVKSALLLAGTEKGSEGNISEEVALKILQKLVKQRKDSATIYNEQGREDLANLEIQQAEYIQRYLPKQLSESEVTSIIEQIILKSNAKSLSDIGKVMGKAMQELQGKAEGKLISKIVKDILGKN